MAGRIRNINEKRKCLSEKPNEKDRLENLSACEGIGLALGNTSITVIINKCIYFTHVLLHNAVTLLFNIPFFSSNFMPFLTYFMNLVPSIPLCWWLLLVSMAIKHNTILLNLITGCFYWLTTCFGQLHDHHQVYKN